MAPWGCVPLQDIEARIPILAVRLAALHAMFAHDRSAVLGAVAKHLPFAIDDFDAVNETFVRWVETGDDGALKDVEVWAYCFVQRYVFVRRLHSPHLANEVDRMVGDIFVRLQSQFDAVEDPARFTRWASVVCRNTFLNGLRRLHPSTELDVAALVDPDAVVDPAYAVQDRALVRKTAERAIARLPESLQDVARLRLLEKRSYKHIAAVTNRPLPTVRTYAAKAIKRLREDADLRALALSLDVVPP